MEINKQNAMVLKNLLAFMFLNPSFGSVRTHLYVCKLLDPELTPVQEVRLPILNPVGLTLTDFDRTT